MKWQGNSETVTGDLNESTDSDVSRTFGSERNKTQGLWTPLEASETGSGHSGTHYVQKITVECSSVGNLWVRLSSPRIGP